MRAHRGFTLIEVMVALFIAGVMVVAVAQVVSQRVDIHVSGQLRTHAALCARELMAEFQLERYWPAPGRAQGEMRQGGQTCYWQAEVSSTGLRSVRRAELSLFSDAQRRAETARYSLFLAAP